jgi:hypothetical protein
MDAALYEPGSVMPPGQDGVQGESPDVASSSPGDSPPPDVHALLAEMMFRWGGDWEIRRDDLLWVARRREVDDETGAVTYLDIELAASSALMLDLELAVREAFHADR